MFEKKHVIFRTDASPEQAAALLRSRTATGAADPHDFVGMVKDTLGAHDAPFRGEVAGPTFKVTRRVRGRRVRIALTGTLEAKPGGTEVRASMAAPPLLVGSLFAGLVALLIVVGGVVASGASQLLLLALLAAQAGVVGISSKLYDRETSATFSALRDAIPEHVAPLDAVAPVVSSDDAAREERSRARHDEPHTHR